MERRSSLPTRPRWSPRRQVARRSEEHTSELQSQSNLVCRLLLEKKKTSQPVRDRALEELDRFADQRALQLATQQLGDRACIYLPATRDLPAHPRTAH